MKRLITFFMCFISATVLLNAQGIVISDILKVMDFEAAPENRGYSLESAWEYTASEVVANPSKTGSNLSENVFMGTRNTGGWNSGMRFAFTTPVEVGTRTTIRVQVYSEDRDTYVYLKLLLAGTVIKEGWSGGPVVSNGQWGYGALGISGIATFDKIEVYLSDSWGTTNTATTAYVDEVELYNESYAYQAAFMNMVYSAPKTTEVMEIDGLDLEDIWLDATYAPIEKIAAGDGVGIGGEWAAVWDADYLYIYALVTDNTVWKWSDASWAGWSGDGFQVYLDVLARRIDGRTFGNLSGFDISADRESQAAIDAGKGFATSLPFGAEFKLLAKQSSIMGGTGYSIEVAWPWTGLAFGAGTEITDPAAWVAEHVNSGLEIAFDLQLNDADDATGRVNMVSWASEPKEPYGNSGTWGGLKLAGGGTGVANNAANFGSRVYPSVTSEYLNVSMKNLRKVEIFDITGKSLISKIAQSDDERFNVSSLNNGVYLVRASNGAHSAVQKFVKK